MRSGHSAKPAGCCPRRISRTHYPALITVDAPFDNVRLTQLMSDAGLCRSRRAWLWTGLQAPGLSTERPAFRAALDNSTS